MRLRKDAVSNDTLNEQGVLCDHSEPGKKPVSEKSGLSHKREEMRILHWAQGKMLCGQR